MSAAPQSLIITIDTEGDNIWASPEKVTTENAKYLPRFQALCEEYGFKPTYLVNYEMAIDPYFQSMGRKMLADSTGEIGLHVHAWDSPPQNGHKNGNKAHVYMYELPDEVIYEKIVHLTDLLSRTFDIRPISHRAGRWGIDERIARMLVQAGYLVDCSVTPGVSWKKYMGSPTGAGGPDYFQFPTQPYFLDLGDIRNSRGSELLEVPMTIRPNYGPTLQRFHHSVENLLVGKAMRRALGPPYTWFRPNGKNLDGMLSLIDWVIDEELPVLEFMLHSSELMPGGSPRFDTEEKIETLYQHLNQVFSKIRALGISCMTLGEYQSAWRKI